MNLKSYIGLKFILYLIGLLSVTFFIFNNQKANKKSEKVNELLIENINLYQKLNSLGLDDILERDKLNKSIQVNNMLLKSEDKKSQFSFFELNIWIVLFLIIGFTNLFSFFNKKIEVLKAQEN